MRGVRTISVAYNFCGNLRFTQRADHRVLPGIPESEYLRGYLYESMAAF